MSGYLGETSRESVRIAKAAGGMKMEIKINNGKFYALEAGNEKYVTDNKQEAIAKLKELFKAGKLTVELEQVKVMEVDTGFKGKDGKITWQISQIPWLDVMKVFMGA